MERETPTNDAAPDMSDLERAAYTSILEAYYSDAVKTAGLARQRAHAGYAIVTALAGVAIAAFTGTQLSGRALATRVVGSVAVVAWLASAALFLRAVAGTTMGSLNSQLVESHKTVARMILDRAKEDARLVERRLQVAIFTTYAALALSAATFSAYAFLGSGPSSMSPRVSVLTIDRPVGSDPCSDPFILKGEPVNARRLTQSTDGVELKLSAKSRVYIPAARIAAVCSAP